MIWLIFIAVMILSAIVQSTLSSRFNRYSNVPCALSGAEVAEKMLRDHGIRDVKVCSIRGMLTDHYDPTKKVINLSEAVYSRRSIAAAAVAAHETGHAIQHAEAYGPLTMRSAMVPVVNFANNIVSIVLLIGIIMIDRFPFLLYTGIALFGITTLFSFITLPVEIDASQRAVRWLEVARITDDGTTPMAKDALKWAAYTYVIAALGSLATLFYYISIALGSRD